MGGGARRGAGLLKARVSFGPAVFFINSMQRSTRRQISNVKSGRLDTIFPAQSFLL